MRLADLVTVSRAVRDAPGRLDKTGALAAFLRKLAPEEISPAVSWLSGTLRQGRIGIGWAQLGPVVAAPANQPSLGLLDVEAAFDRLSRVSGGGATAERGRLLGALFAQATADERDLLVPLIGGELRQGALAGVMIEAVALASGVPVREVRRAVMVAGDLGEVARVALFEGAPGLARFDVRLFVPVLPMLADTAEDVTAALARLGRAAFEHKLDGARVQVHRSGEEVRVFTRRLNEVSEFVPELVEAVRALPVREVILDGEALVLRPDGRPHDFQTTMSRFGRRLDVDRLRGELPLRPFFFDCLYLDGESLLARATDERVQALAALPADLRIPRRVTSDDREAREFLASALAAGHEGVVAKSLTAPYEAGRRGQAWLKIKRATTLDLVVLAAEWGHGRRQGWLSNLHLGARASEGFVMLGKTFKGMTDEMLAWQTRRLQELEVSRDGDTVHVRPELVVEVAFDGVQRSRYPGGFALRFARVRDYRPDKRANEADTIETVRALHERATGGRG